MGASRIGRARRITPAVEIHAQHGSTPNYGSSFAVDLLGADNEPPEQWARTILEGAPQPLRWFVFFGWKVVLRLRLAPRGPDTIAGWTITTTTSDAITLEVESRFIAARKVLLVDQNRLTLTTYVWYQRKVGLLLWSTLAPVHHCIEPLLLTLATSPRRKA